MVCPLQTVLDDSIGCAIWFAARGLGKKFILNGDNQLELKDEQYKSKVKVIIYIYIFFFFVGINVFVTISKVLKSVRGMCKTKQRQNSSWICSQYRPPRRQHLILSGTLLIPCAFRFHVLLNFCSKYFSSFPSRYLFAIGLVHN